jgi:hypothetical protein
MTQNEYISEKTQLKKDLSILANFVQNWCDAIARDSTWDGWDSYYKSAKYGDRDKTIYNIIDKYQTTKV